MGDERTMNAADIARHLGCDPSQVSRWKKAGDLGDPVNPGSSRPRYPESRIIELGKRKGYLDANGRSIVGERDTTARRRPIPLPHVPEGREEMHYYVPDIAAIYGAPEETVHIWVHRGWLHDGQGGDVAYADGQYNAYPRSAVERIAQEHPGKKADFRRRRA